MSDVAVTALGGSEPILLDAAVCMNVRSNARASKVHVQQLRGENPASGAGGFRGKGDPILSLSSL